jgi:hypothetical protein
MACTILTLSFMPCLDSASEMSSKAKTELSKSNSQGDKDHKDDCSPFCHCSCCAGFSINHVITSADKPEIVCNKDVDSYMSENIIKVSFSVWQPPRS